MSKNIKKKEKIKPSMIVWFIYSIGSRIYMFFKNRIKVNRKIFKKRNKKGLPLCKPCRLRKTAALRPYVKKVDL